MTLQLHRTPICVILGLHSDHVEPYGLPRSYTVGNSRMQAANIPRDENPQLPKRCVYQVTNLFVSTSRMAPRKIFGPDK
jgi:hypothetical protein